MDRGQAKETVSFRRVGKSTGVNMTFNTGMHKQNFYEP